MLCAWSRSALHDTALTMRLRTWHDHANGIVRLPDSSASPKDARKRVAVGAPASRKSWTCCASSSRKFLPSKPYLAGRPRPTMNMTAPPAA